MEGSPKELLKRWRRTLKRWLEKYRARPRVRYPHGDVLRGELCIGERTVLGRGVVVDCSGTVRIGRHCVISDRVYIVTHTHDFLKGDVPDITAEKGVSASGLTIGDNVFIGREALILSRAGQIGESAIIGARSVLTRDVGPGEIWAGNPAVKVGDRSGADGGERR